MPKMFNHEKFLESFRNTLLSTKRAEAFTHATRVLSRKPKALIIETGCIRKLNDWEGAGQSTNVWDWCAKESDGLLRVWSIDNSPNHVATATPECPNVKVVLSDSVAWLHRHPEEIAQCDLLYLDSKDHDPPYGESELHAAAELYAAWPHLPKGCMVMVDDCNPDGTGKHFLVRQFFERVGVPQEFPANPKIHSHTIIWRKP